ncbi:Intradiol ring-cleavage dioxygenase [Tenacibaculum sp. 190130A14a]|uniref:Intradiol ring-cleavage dioxygenase n=1 Tax=Tenacibaculum polynesiense TaxID=3137857 RepID=A0ABM9PDK6_9FLAO
MKKLLGLLCITFIMISCKGQSQTIKERNVGGSCQDCIALLDYKTLNKTLKPIDTLPGFNENAPKLKITGTIFQKDGKTPAENIIIYVYHVDRTGRYTPSARPFGWEKRHGQYRGWLKTTKDGKFTFYTFRPASYPGTQIAEHIHIYLKEPNTTPYYIDSYLFESDPNLTENERHSQKKRGGSGIVQLKKENDIWVANRNITLGLNISNY